MKVPTFTVPEGHVIIISFFFQCCPGYVETDMSSGDDHVTPDEGKNMSHEME